MTAFYKFIADVAFHIHWDSLAEWAMRAHRKRTAKDFES
jgi:hypothetical protein